MNPQLALALYRAQFALLFAIAPGIATRKALQLFSTPMNVKVRRREAELLAQATHSDIHFDGITIRLYRWQNSSETAQKQVSPKQALLVHGWEGNGGSLGAFVPMLVEQGYEVLSFDGPAHNASKGESTNLFHYAGLIRHILTMHPAIDTVLAHSFGCAASTVALHDSPNVHLQRFVLLSTPDKLADVLGEFTSLMHISENNKERLFREIQRRYGRAVEDMEVSAFLPNVQSNEILLIHDSEDRIIPYSRAERVYEQNPHIQFHTIRSVGHYRMLWHPEVLERVQSFLRATISA